MRIGFDLRVLSTGRITGIEEYTLQLAKHLVANDRDNTYAFYYNSFSSPLDPFFSDKDVYYNQSPNKFLDLSLKLFSRPYLDVLTKSELFFSPHCLLTPLQQAERVLTVHDLSFVRFPEFFSARHHFWLRWMDIKKQIKNADRIVVPSNCTKYDLVDLFNVPEEKIRRIYHGVDSFFSKRFEEDELRQFRKEHQLPEKFILYLGTIEPRKNITNLIRAVELVLDEYRDVHLVIAGNLGWLFKKSLRAIGESRHRDRILLKQGLLSKDRPKLYQSAQAFVYPSFFEGFGLQPIEAQMSHVPVVASNRSSLPEILGDSAILIDPYNILDLAEALKIVLTEEKTRARLIRKGKENAVQFSWDLAAEQYLDLFSSRAR